MEIHTDSVQLFTIRHYHLSLSLYVCKSYAAVKAVLTPQVYCVCVNTEYKQEY